MYSFFKHIMKKSPLILLVLLIGALPGGYAPMPVPPSPLLASGGITSGNPTSQLQPPSVASGLGSDLIVYMIPTMDEKTGELVCNDIQVSLAFPNDGPNGAGMNRGYQNVLIQRYRNGEFQGEDQYSSLPGSPNPYGGPIIIHNEPPPEGEWLPLKVHITATPAGPPAPPYSTIPPPSSVPYMPPIANNDGWDETTFYDPNGPRVIISVYDEALW
jgi:hypothetical protein